MNTHTESFNQFLTNNLSPIQQEAVRHKDGSLLVIAGAGSGKTRVITARIAHLILNESVHPSSIIALTFTNKAAREMQERIRAFLGGGIAIPFVGTFHAYCLRMLKGNAHLLDKPFVSVLDSDDQEKIIKGIIKRFNLDKKTSAQQLIYQISHIKNHSINPESLDFSYAENPFIKDIFNAYETEKRQSKCFDFDDLLLEALRLFKNNQSFKEAFQQNVQHILVDEYQDTNVVQHALLQQMTKDKNKVVAHSICVVGDEDQSIYSWRGATVANILHFKKDFTNTKTIKLEQNYRSVQPILDIANTVINYNKNRNPKKLWSEHSAADCIRQLTCLSDYQEGDTIAQFLLVARTQQKLSSIALLYRTHFQSRSLEEALIRHSIPYKIIGGIQFYERKEIKDLLAYVRLVANPFDRTSFFRVVNTPARSLGIVFEELFKSQWDEQPFLPFTDLAKIVLQEGVVTGAKKGALLQFISVFDGLDHTQLTSQVVHTILNKTGYFSYLKKQYADEEAAERIDNIKELVRAITHFEQNGITSVTAFLDEVTLIQDHNHENNNAQDPVLLMTLHAAKGLEFHTVILTGIEEGLLPSSRSLYDSEQIEEERRLFYVGITRAQQRLLFTHCRHRYTFGSMQDQAKSRFLAEVPPTLAPVVDISRFNQRELQTLFQQWLNPSLKTTSSVLTFGKPAQAKQVQAKNGTIDKKKVGRTTTTKLTTGKWRTNQIVHHKTFGSGIIKNIEKRDTGEMVIQVQFKSGLKKIAERFLLV